MLLCALNKIIIVLFAIMTSEYGGHHNKCNMMTLDIKNRFQ